MNAGGETRKPKAEGGKKSETRSPKFWHQPAVQGSDFGFRISAFFRPSGFGLRVSTLLLAFCVAIPSSFAAEPDGTTGLPASSLKPPRGEIQPSWWEQHGTLIVLGALALIALVGLAIWLIFRPKPPPAPIPSAEQARGQLELLRQQPEDGALLSKTSQIVHGYISTVFGIPSVQLTTSEFCQVVAENQAIGPGLAREIGEFLHECDVRKFAPRPPSVPFGAVARSLALIDRAENRLLELRGATTGGSSSNLNASSSGVVAEQIANKP